MSRLLPAPVVWAWFAAFPLTLATPGLFPTLAWTTLLFVGVVTGILRRIFPTWAAGLVVVCTAAIVTLADVGGFGLPAQNLLLGAAALLGLGLRTKLRAAVTAPNVLVSGGFGVMVGGIVGTELRAHLLDPQERGLGGEGEALVWMPFLLVMISALPLVVFAVGYLATRRGRAWMGIDGAPAGDRRTPRA